MALFGKFPSFGKRPNSSLESQPGSTSPERMPTDEKERAVIPEVMALFDEGVNRARTMVNFASPGVDEEHKKELLAAIDSVSAVTFRDDIMDPTHPNYAYDSFPQRVNTWMRINLVNGTLGPILSQITEDKSMSDEDHGDYLKLITAIRDLYPVLPSSP